MAKPEIPIPQGDLNQFANRRVQDLLHDDPDFLARPLSKMMVAAASLRESGDESAKIFRRVQFDADDQYGIEEVSYVLTFNERMIDGKLWYSKVRLGTYFDGEEFVVVNDHMEYHGMGGRQFSGDNVKKYVREAHERRIPTTQGPSIMAHPHGLLERDPNNGQITYKSKVSY